MKADVAEAAFWAAYIRNRNVDVATADDGAVAVAGGYAICVPSTDYQLALGLGWKRALRPDDLAVVRAFYGRRGVPSRLELRDEVRERDRAVLEAAGFAENDLVLHLYEADALASAPPAHVTVKQTTDRPSWLRLSTRAFADGGEPDERSRQTAVFASAAAQGLFVAEIDGVPAGAGAVLLAGDYAYLYGGAVLPEFRRRGVHTALLHARAAFGFARDARKAAIKARVGSESEASVRKAGFEHVETLRRLTAVASEPAP